MVSKEHSIKLILKEFPDFNKQWDEYLSYWDGVSPNYSLEMSEFSRYVIELLKKQRTDIEYVKKIFNFIEMLIIEGNEEVRTAVTTCLLENLLNSVSWERILSETFVPYLGIKSKEYCKSWDKFTGVKTPGLWD